MGRLNLSFYLVVFTVLILSSGCGSSKSDGEKNVVNSGFSWDQSKSVSLDCYGQDCDPSIVEIHTEWGDFKSRCSGVALNDGILLTASHCLPPHFLKDRSCKDKVQIRSLSSQLTMECLRVQKMVDLSGVERGALTSDFAVIEININLNFKSRFSMASNYQPSLGDEFDIYWFKDGKTNRTLEVTQCASLNYNPFTGGGQTTGQSGWFVGPCSVVPGASGGAVTLRGTKKIIGVVSQSAEDLTWAYISLLK